MSVGRVNLNQSLFEEVFSLVSKPLLNCPSCGKLASYYDSPHLHQWSKRLICECRRDWLVCMVCRHQRVHLVESRQICRHASKCSVKVQRTEDDGSTRGRKRSAATRDLDAEVPFDLPSDNDDHTQDSTSMFEVSKAINIHSN
jgi:hypothetical protein